MPKASNIYICDLPVRFDTYKGCSHGCKYCFACQKYDISKVELGEPINSLANWIRGYRTRALKCFDWDIPIHWGGNSDPFQDCERKYKQSNKALHLFADSNYPFVVSTKGRCIMDYKDLIKDCNCVIQISLVCPEYDAYETGAAPFAERLKMIETLSKDKRVIVRVQPYHISMFKSVLKSIKQFADAGAYGVTFEGMKYKSKKPLTVKSGGDFAFRIVSLKKDFTAFKELCHAYGMKFYSAENRLRSLGDDLCCCGIDGMGWHANKANLNHYLYDNINFKYTDRMMTSKCIDGLKRKQDNRTTDFINSHTYSQIMDIACHDKKLVSQLLPYDVI